MSVVAIVRVPFVLCTASALFYSRTLSVSLVVLALLAWLGFYHPHATDVAYEFLAFGVSGVLGLLATVALWALLVLERPSAAREPFIRDLDVLHRHASPAGAPFSVDTMRWLARVILALFYTVLLYLCSEALRYQRSNVHRWSSLAAMLVVSFVAYVYDKHVSDAYSLRGVYRLLDAVDAHMHFRFAALCALAILIDIVFHQSALQNTCTLVALALFVLSRLDRVRALWAPSSLRTTEANKSTAMKQDRD
jgi:hypothetical protein